MKRALCSLLLLPALLLSGCASQDPAEPTPTPPAATPSPSGVELPAAGRPLTEEEIASLGVEKREIVVSYQVGDNVKITDGALESFLGTVEEIDLDRSKVRVVVSMFGRETPVELELDQVEPVQD